MGFGKELLRLQKKAGWSAERLAKALGVGASKLRKWEERDSEPKPEDKEIIENKFGISLDEISKLTELPKDLEGSFVKDASAVIINNQIELIAGQRVILSILAEVQAPQMKEKTLSTQLSDIYRNMVKDVVKQVREEQMTRQ